MADQEVEGGLGAEETTALPTPKVSSGASEAPAPSAAPAVDVQRLASEVAKQLLPEFRDIASKTAQGKVDKFAYQFGTMKQYLDDAKGDPKVAARNMAIDQLVEEKQAPAQQDLGGSQEQVQRRTERILKRAADKTGVRIKNSDSRLQALSEQEWSSVDDWYDAVEELAYSAKVSAAAVAGGTQGAPPGGSDDVESLTSQLQESRAKGASTQKIKELSDKLMEALKQE